MYFKVSILYTVVNMVFLLIKDVEFKWFVMGRAERREDKFRKIEQNARCNVT